MKFYNINHSWVPSDYFSSTYRINFSFNLREMVAKHPCFVIQAKISKKMCKFYQQSVLSENRTEGEMSLCGTGWGKQGTWVSDFILSTVQIVFLP